MKKSQLQKSQVQQASVQEIPLFKSSDNFWKYIDYKEDEIQQIDTFFIAQNENIEQLMKKSCFKNMETLASQFGNHMHVNFTEQINIINEQKKQKEIKLEKLKQMEEEKVQKQLEMLKQLQFQDNSSQQQEVQEENQDKQDKGDKGSQSSNVQSQTSKQTKQSKEISKQPIENQEKEKQQSNEDEQGLYSDQKYWIFKNTKIDYLTFRCFTFQLKFTNIQTVKLSSVIFNEQEQNQLIQLIQQSCLKILYLEWTQFIGNVNNILQELAQSQIQTLFLRNNKLQDENYQIFFQTLTQNEKLECLEIYDNNFGEIGNKFLSKGLTYLCEYLTVNQTLQNLGLPKNNLKDVKQILNLVKTKPFTEADMPDYQEKEKKRQEQIQRSSKSNQKQPIIFPPIEKIVYIQDQVSVMNHKLMTINLSQNNIDDYDCIEELLQNSLNDFRIILTHNGFSDSQKRNLRQINQNKILI